MTAWNWKRMRERHRLATAAPQPDERFESCTERIDGAGFHWRASRDDRPGATPVVLVHGLAVSHRYLMPLADLLAEHYPVRVVDLPGFGLSEDPGTVEDIPALADRLASWLKATGNAPAAVLGNSVGCQVAVDLAVRHPAMVRCLVLVGPTMDPEAPTMPRQTLRWLRSLPHEDPSQVPVILRDFVDAGPVRFWKTFRYALRDHVEYKLPEVTVPALVTRGAKESVVPQRWIAEAVRLLPKGEGAVVPDGPHDTNYSKPEELAGLVLPFLERHAAGRPE
jgi:pimeloyl-ACP methyl ester carboxylesterase